ncbi:MAG: lysophospholipid transporter LplT [Negativicutes bacterium]|jgi:LPLT family lysophospholipid transporter-like MFS transporter
MWNLNKGIWALVGAQFWSAFGDQMMFFIVIAIISKQHNSDSLFILIAQSAFLVSYIIFCPYVGRIGDRFPKKYVLMTGNGLKAFGILLAFFAVNPVLSYFVVGMGAVIYMPAKYGILPVLSRDDDVLMKANAAVEGGTLLAILFGGVAGEYIAAQSIDLSLAVCFAILMFSMLLNFAIPRNEGNKSIVFPINPFSFVAMSLRGFASDMKTVFTTSVSRFCVMGTATFWTSSTVLRMILLVWLPLHLGIDQGHGQSVMLALTGIGVAIGSFLAPLFITIKTYSRTIIAGVLMAVSIALLAFISGGYIITALILVLIGVFGGVFFVPLNATLQDMGERSIGAGCAVASQNWLEFSAMFSGILLYMAADNMKFNIDNVILGGVILQLLLMLVMSKTAKIIKRNS